MAHPCAFFAQGWDSTTAPCLRFPRSLPPTHWRRPDLDTIPAESTSIRDELGVDSRQRREQRGNVRAGEGSGLYGLDATGEPTDLFEEDARRRYLELLTHEKDAEQQRVAGVVDKK